jgi:hypothetical protein
MVKKSFGAAATVILLLCAVFTLEYGRAQEDRKSGAATYDAVHGKGEGWTNPVTRL